MKLKLFSAAAITVLFGFSCKKDNNNPLHNDGQVPVGSYLSITETINQNVDFADPASSVGIKVKSVGAAVDKIKMYVVEGTTLDASQWNLLKTVQYSGEGTELSTTNADMKAALGADLQPGVQYTIYDQVITTDGRTFDLTNVGSNVESPDFYAAFEWTVNAVAPYTGNMAGDYKILVDGWADWAVGTVLPAVVTDGPGANQITTTVYPNPLYGTSINPIVVDIDAATGVATVPAVLYGDYGPHISCQGAGYVFSATGTIDLTLNHFVGDPSNTYGNFRLVMKKQ